MAPQPPGPGLPEQAPSVWTMTWGSLMRAPVETRRFWSSRVQSPPLPNPARLRASSKRYGGREQTERVAAAVSSSDNSVIPHAGDCLVEAQLAGVFERVLGAHQRAGRHVEPVDQPRQQ